jgi:hypothetical protein
MVEDGPGLIPDHVRRALKIAACYLHLHKLDEMPISKSLCAGFIKTKWSSHMVGNRAGILFKSSVALEEGEYRVNFLLNQRDLERGAETLRRYENEEAQWNFAFDEAPVEALYEFEDLRHAGTVH